MPRGVDRARGRERRPAPFGENLSTVDALERDVRIGDVWTWDGATLQVSQPRWPCFKLALYRERADTQARLRSSGRTGWYLRVLEPGEVGARGPIEVSARDPRGVTVHDAHLALADHHLVEPERVRAVANHPALADQWRVPLVDRLERCVRRRAGTDV